MTAVGRLAKEAGLLSTCHSAGYINPEPLEELTQVLDAACIDLKSFDPHFYQELVDGKLEPVLNTLKTLRRRGVHLEIVNLVIPQFNDQPKTISDMCAWIRDELGPLTPLHFSRFYPLYKMQNHFPTPVSTLEGARELALKAGPEIRLPGQYPRAPGGEHLLPRLRQVAHRPPGLPGGRDAPEGGRLRILRRQDSRHLEAKAERRFSVFGFRFSVTANKTTDFRQVNPLCSHLPLGLRTENFY